MMPVRGILSYIIYMSAIKIKNEQQPEIVWVVRGGERQHSSIYKLSMHFRPEVSRNGPCIMASYGGNIVLDYYLDTPII